MEASLQDTLPVDHGPLPTVLGVLTLLTGFIDAVTYLKYGHVFVANMTGNVIFLGFGLAGDHEISILGTLLALLGFLLGALIGGWFNQRLASHRANLVAGSSLAKAVLLVSATTAAALGAASFIVIPLLGVTMGIQNAVARKLAIPDVTTTVLTMTLTGLMADSSIVGGKNPRIGRRLAAVVTMFFGALVGATMVLNLGIPFALGTAAAIVVVVSLSAYLLGRGNPPWVHAR
jgi:uncharacterized membrane protein YoaK (UPF0700 family)